MNLITTHEVPSFPKDVLIGWSPLKPYESEQLPFIDSEFIRDNDSSKRRGEHYSSRKLFGEMLNTLDLSSEFVELKKMELGKPYAMYKNEILHTSFSHSSEWVVCAISKKIDVGIDCEPLDRKVNHRIFTRILDENEQWVLNELSELAVWTIKEAVVKCIGTGIRTSLQKFKIQKEEEYFSVHWENEQILVIPFIWENHQLAMAWKA